MIDLKTLLGRPWRGVHEARDELAKSEAEVDEVKELSNALRRIHDENHITNRIHAAFRGEK
jgi:hypothetical protein